MAKIYRRGHFSPEEKRAVIARYRELRENGTPHYKITRNDVGAHPGTVLLWLREEAKSSPRKKKKHRYEKLVGSPAELGSSSARDLDAPITLSARALLLIIREASQSHG